MTMKRNILILLISFIWLGTAAQNKQTFVYSVKGTDTLRLDKYDKNTDNKLKPCIIYMFGGGFMTGQRDGEEHEAYFKKLTDLGYTVVSIDYRLGLKEIAIKAKAGEKIGAKEMITSFGNAINIAVEDLFDATNYVIANAEKWNIDKNMIVANGSSAGAISVLQGEYYICSENELASKLPPDFNYAGVISFAGAIFSTNGNLKWTKQPAPLQMFHGNADSNVPYDKIKIFKLGFFGSKNLASQMKKSGYAYYFYDVNNAAHEIAVSPMTLNLEEIKTFLDKLVTDKKKISIHTQVDQLDKPELKKNIGIKDIIKGNFGGQ